ncbi:hypothetical protein [Sulfurirhabdus autotrophica]|uniref:4Fe-4S ferredoxin-type domain-containing protein n=1 Tax=Sulfurirhabdus autotrophica TaxID=1706046 RepID=A0A4R3YBF1_9PROT|nr:hypothetical protein [Sulfurirhabdus autotrophica]TCV89061.1 hypothetical protein EDC63_103133 [Sulfurirhabdus autotrophica]
MHQHQPFHPAIFNQAGLNLQAIFNLDQLPPEMLIQLDEPEKVSDKYRQLILLGHGGKAMWASLQASGIQSENPVDDFTVRTIADYFSRDFPDCGYALIYPGIRLIGLQSLGKLAGWHHSSPLKVGINAAWGTWFAYRAVVLADTNFKPTSPLQGVSPCNSCQHKVCIDHCPASALADGVLNFQKCVDYRKQPASKCKTTCLARVSCPVASDHRYCDEQIRYHYGLSMKTIEQKY